MTNWSRAGLPAIAEVTAVDVTVAIEPDGKVEVTISDETGWNPEPCDTMLRQARDTAVAAHRELHHARKP